MSEVLSQLGRLFVQSVPTIIFVFLLFVILDRLFFRPVGKVLKEREEATVGAQGRAGAAAAAAEAKLRGYEAALQAARLEVHRLREAARRESLKEREGTLQNAREQAALLLQEAQASLSAEVAAAQRDLTSASRALAEQIAATILGQPAQAGPASPTAETGGPRI